ncbi:MAG TPA: hypothetical protein ENI27_05110 [bacterium]|nr:hypothetical protein [bacterium]
MTNLLESVYGYREIGYLDFKKSKGEDVYNRLHAEPSEQFHRLINSVTSAAFVSPLRDPVLSFLSRYMNTVGEPSATWTVQDSAVRWARLMEVAEKRRIFYFPVAVESQSLRRFLMKAFAAHIKPEYQDASALANLLAEWSPVGAYGISAEKCEYLETGKIEGIDLSPLDPAKAWFERMIRGS